MNTHWTYYKKYKKYKKKVKYFLSGSDYSLEEPSTYLKVIDKITEQVIFLLEEKGEIESSQQLKSFWEYSKKEDDLKSFIPSIPTQIITLVNDLRPLVSEDEIINLIAQQWLELFNSPPEKEDSPFNLSGSESEDEDSPFNLSGSESEDEDSPFNLSGSESEDEDSPFTLSGSESEGEDSPFTLSGSESEGEVIPINIQNLNKCIREIPDHLEEISEWVKSKPATEVNDWSVQFSIPGDGDCFYHSICVFLNAYQLTRDNGGELWNSTSLRQFLIKRLSNLSVQRGEGRDKIASILKNSLDNLLIKKKKELENKKGYLGDNSKGFKNFLKGAVTGKTLTIEEGTKLLNDTIKKLEKEIPLLEKYDHMGKSQIPKNLTRELLEERARYLQNLNTIIDNISHSVGILRNDPKSRGAPGEGYAGNEIISIVSYLFDVNILVRKYEDTYPYLGLAQYNEKDQERIVPNYSYELYTKTIDYLYEKQVPQINKDKISKSIVTAKDLFFLEKQPNHFEIRIPFYNKESERKLKKITRAINNFLSSRQVERSLGKSDYLTHQEKREATLKKSREKARDNWRRTSQYFKPRRESPIPESPKVSSHKLGKKTSQPLIDLDDFTSQPYPTRDDPPEWTYSSIPINLDDYSSDSSEDSDDEDEK